MNFKTVGYAQEGVAAIITLGRPERLNAWTPEMGREIIQATEVAALDSSVRAIIITGSGKGFCAGMDFDCLKETEENSSRDRTVAFDARVPAGSQRPDYRGLFTFFPSVGKPVIAAINGAAAGSGLALALSCDVRFADEKAILTTSFVKWGLVAEHGVGWLLARHVGTPAALDLLFSGKKVSAREAKSLGLITEVCTDESALDTAKRYVERVAAECSPRSIQVMKRQVWDAELESLESAIGIANREMLKSFSQYDFDEALRAFMNGRSPVFSALGEGA